MQADNRVIIADDSSHVARRQVYWTTFAGCLLVGAAAAVVVAREGLTLSHYDARGHLVVARRVLDSLTPGWRQIGAVWLPLPHLINLLPAGLDWNFRTGYLSAGISVLSLAAGLAALAGLLFQITRSRAAAWLGPALILLNPNVLYLQSTPMTEPLLFGCALVALAAVYRWAREPSARRATAPAAAAIAALMLSRYEGWAIAGALVGWAAFETRMRALPLVWTVAGTVAAFLLLSWGTTGEWFVASGFFVPDNPSRHDLIAVIGDVVDATRSLGGDSLVAAALAGALLVWRPSAVRAGAPVLLALAAAAALPISAFYEGHPLRVRYMVPLVVAAGALVPMLVAAFPRRVQPLLAVAAGLLIISGRPPLDPTAAMVVEAQWETPYRLDRQAITGYLQAHYDGTPILASMGSLAHYMQEASQAGLRLRDFVHEGTGDLWSEAVRSPARHVRWVAIEGRAEGGDVLAARRRADPTFLDGFDAVAEGGGVVLYRREKP